MKSVIPAGPIESRILSLRGQKVLLDRDLSELYGVTTGVLNQAVKRNSGRFPADFMFRLHAKEVQNLKSQIVISSSGWGGRRSQPLAFTEHGVAMLASVLRSERAVRVNIAIVRAFVRMRQFLATHQDLARKLDQLERQNDARFRVVFEAIEHLMGEQKKKRNRKMGFVRET